MTAPIEVKAEVLGVESVVLRLRGAVDEARASVRAKVQKLGIELQRKVKDGYLTGLALRVRTGRLRRSVNERTEVAGDEVSSSVGTNVVYGRRWELGFSGVEQVREHVRRCRSGAQAFVRAHQRQVNTAARPFLQPALADMRPRVHAELAQGVV